MHVDQGTRKLRVGKLNQESFAGCELDRGIGERGYHSAQCATNDVIVIHDRNFLPWCLHLAILQQQSPSEIGLVSNAASGLQYASEADEIGDRANAHFPHHPPAMDVDSFLHGAEFGGNLLVQPPGNDTVEYFLLAGVFAPYQLPMNSRDDDILAIARSSRSGSRTFFGRLMSASTASGGPVGDLELFSPPLRIAYFLPTQINRGERLNLNG
jgi:hypothetical protein